MRHSRLTLTGPMGRRMRILTSRNESLTFGVVMAEGNWGSTHGGSNVVTNTDTSVISRSDSRAAITLAVPTLQKKIKRLVIKN